MTKDTHLMSFVDQEDIRQKIKKLHWLEQRFGDNAKIQGFDQSEVLMQIIQCALLLRLGFVARSHQITED